MIYIIIPTYLISNKKRVPYFLNILLKDNRYTIFYPLNNVDF